MILSGKIVLFVRESKSVKKNYHMHIPRWIAGKDLITTPDDHDVPDSEN